MGRRKIEIKAIKDDRNRSVTFLKRKGGLFKKAHELSVLCSVDVAVFIFGNNKKLYEYSSGDMRELVTRYTYHGNPNEHKGPTDYNGGDDDEDEDGDGTPPHGHEGSVEPQMIPPHYQGQPAFPHLRHHTPSASPPINGMPFVPRGHTPTPQQMGSRPNSRTDFRRPNMPQPGPPGPPPMANGYAYMPQPAIYNPQTQASMHNGVPPPPPPPAPYQYAAAHTPQMQPYIEEPRHSSVPPSYPPTSRPHPSPPQIHISQMPQPAPHMSPQPPSQHLEVPGPRPMPQPQPQQHAPEAPLQPSAQMDPPHLKMERSSDRPSQPGLDTSIIRKLPQRNQAGSIFTPIDDNRSILGQHLDSFNQPDAQGIKLEDGGVRSQSVDVGAVSRKKPSASPPLPQRSNTSGTRLKGARNSVSVAPEASFNPPSRSNSLKMDGAARPRLRVQIPDEASDAGSTTGDQAITSQATASPHGADPSAQPAQRNGNAPNVVLPPPSPSAQTMLSAGATGPPNPFARPPPQNHGMSMNIDTPGSALPSRFLNNEYLPSPSSFWPEWNARGDNSNTLPSPLNFATPVAGSGPSFLRDDVGHNSTKRKSPEMNTAGPASDGPEGFEPKRIKVDG